MLREKIDGIIEITKLKLDKAEKRESKNKCNKQTMVTKMVDINPTKSITTLNMGGLMHQLKF